MKKKALALFLAAAMMFTGVMPMDVVKADEAGAGGGGDAGVETVTPGEGEITPDEGEITLSEGTVTKNSATIQFQVGGQTMETADAFTLQRKRGEEDWEDVTEITTGEAVREMIEIYTQNFENRDVDDDKKTANGFYMPALARTTSDKKNIIAHDVMEDQAKNNKQDGNIYDFWVNNVGGGRGGYNESIAASQNKKTEISFKVRINAGNMKDKTAYVALSDQVPGNGKQNALVGKQVLSIETVSSGAVDSGYSISAFKVNGETVSLDKVLSSDAANEFGAQGFTNSRQIATTGWLQVKVFLDFEKHTRDIIITHTKDNSQVYKANQENFDSSINEVKCLQAILGQGYGEMFFDDIHVAEVNNVDNYTYTDENLTADTTYTYRVVAKAEKKPYSVSKTKDIKTLAKSVVTVTAPDKTITVGEALQITAGEANVSCEDEDVTLASLSLNENTLTYTIQDKDGKTVDKDVARETVGEYAIVPVVVTAGEGNTANKDYDYRAVNGKLTVKANGTVDPSAPQILSVTAANDKTSLKVGETVQLTAEISPSEGNSAVWTSDKDDVAAVSASGLVTAKKAGTAKITAAVKDYPAVKKDITITVTEDTGNSENTGSSQEAGITLSAGAVEKDSATVTFKVPDSVEAETFTVQRKSGTGAWADVTSLNKDAGTVGKAPGEVIYKNDFEENMDGFTSRVSAREYKLMTDSAAKNPKEGKIVGIEYDAATGDALCEYKTNIDSDVVISMDFKLDTTADTRTSRISLLGNVPTAKNNWITNDDDLPIFDICLTSQGNAFTKAAVNGTDADLTKFVGTKEESLDGARESTGWLNVTVVVNFSEKKLEAKVVRLEDGSVVYENVALPFWYDAAEKISDITAYTHKTGGTYIDNFSLNKVVSARTYTYTDTGLKADTAYEYRVVAKDQDGKEVATSNVISVKTKGADTGSSEDTGNSQNTGNSEDTGNSQNTGSSEDTGNSQNTGSSQGGSTDNSQTGNSQGGSTDNSQTGNSQGGNTGDSQTGSSQGGSTAAGPVKGTTIPASDGTKYTVTAQGKEVAYKAPKNKNLKTVSVPDTITINGVKYNVTSIAAKAFEKNGKMTKVTIGKNVTTIGKNAFANCTKLATVTFKKGSKCKTIEANAFKGDKVLKKITIPDKVTKIKDSAFAGCKKLGSVTIGKGLTEIGKNAFSGDGNLKTITIKSAKLKTVGKNALKGTKKNLKIKVPKKQLKSYKTKFKNKGNKTIKVIK